MNQPIIGYHLDEHSDWVADLACGHGQHVRHQPPFFSRPWVLTQEGRTRQIGQLLFCKRCHEPDVSPPVACSSYQRQDCLSSTQIADLLGDATFWW